MGVSRLREADAARARERARKQAIGRQRGNSAAKPRIGAPDTRIRHCECDRPWTYAGETCAKCGRDLGD